MNEEKREDIFVKVKDSAGNELVCPLGQLRDANHVSTAELENCFDGDVIGRYAGRMRVVDPAP